MADTKKEPFEDSAPKLLPVVPTIDVVVFPQMVVPLLVLDEKIINGIGRALEGDKRILLLAASGDMGGSHGPIGTEDLAKVGTIGKVMRAMSLPDGGQKVLVQGLLRCNVDEVTSEEDMLKGTISYLAFDRNENNDSVDNAIRGIISTIENTHGSSGLFGPDFHAILSQINDPERVVDFLLSHLSLDTAQAQKLLEKESLLELIAGIRESIEYELETSKVRESIRTNARDAINRSQREYYLREQLRAIQKELGEEAEDDLSAIKMKIEDGTMPEEAVKEARRQFSRLEKTSPDSLESAVIRNHLDWLTTLPWGVFTEDDLDLKHGKGILDEDHYGLNVIKERILDYLSVRALKNTCDVPILCFAGPPGVGKTSLGRSIARCLGRKFFRISLGGMHDESEIRGHRRTYVGALPGRIIQAIVKAGSSNPVLMIDEIDKVGNSGKGDPSSALLEVLDPEQNLAFYDNYLGVHFDLSKVMFITTANDLDQIPEPLRDRMEVIQLPGYLAEEKVEIAGQHLVPKAIESSGLAGKGVEFHPELIHAIVTRYTRESGVRELDRFIKKLCSKFARKFVEEKEKIQFKRENLIDFLGPSKVLFDKKLKNHKIGVTNGLAWTPYGGEVLQVEAVLMPGKGKLTLTGQLGEVMRESAQAAVSYIRSHAGGFGLDKSIFTDYALHIHLPAGAVPKDGPSAGITLLSSILSVLTGREIDGNFAMTGELDLQGGVLPIGGLKEKILAAKQYGLENVIVPKDNERDLHGIDEMILKGIRLHFVDKVEEVIERVLLPKS